MSHLPLSTAVDTPDGSGGEYDRCDEQRLQLILYGPLSSPQGLHPYLPRPMDNFLTMHDSPEPVSLWQFDDEIILPHRHRPAAATVVYAPPCIGWRIESITEFTKNLEWKYRRWGRIGRGIIVVNLLFWKNQRQRRHQDQYLPRCSSGTGNETDAQNSVGRHLEAPLAVAASIVDVQVQPCFPEEPTNVAKPIGQSEVWQSASMVVVSNILVTGNQEPKRTDGHTSENWYLEAPLALDQSKRPRDNAKAVGTIDDVTNAKKSKGKSNRRSKVWEHFNYRKDDDGAWAYCIHCTNRLAADSKGHGTSGLRRHLMCLHHIVFETRLKLGGPTTPRPSHEAATSKPPPQRKKRKNEPKDLAAPEGSAPGKRIRRRNKPSSSAANNSEGVAPSSASAPPPAAKHATEAPSTAMMIASSQIALAAAGESGEVVEIGDAVPLMKVREASDRTQVEAKDLRLSDMPPVTLDDSKVHTKTDDNAEMNIAEDLDNRPSKKAKISESGVLEPSPMSATMSASNPVSECFESIVPESDNQIDHDPVPESDNQIDHDPLPSPPSPSSSTLTPVLTLHDVKEPDPNRGIKVDETYDYLPQDYTLTDHDLCAHIAIKSSLTKQLLVQIDGSCVLQNQLMCLLNEKEWVNDDVINAYICCIKDQIHLQNDNKVYFESPFVTSLFKRDGELGIQEGSAFMTETVIEYMQHDMIKLPINANNTHWYLAVVNTKKREVQVLDSLCWNFDRDDLAHTLRGVQFHLDLLKSQNLVKDNWKDVNLTEWKITEQLQKAIQKDSTSCGLFMVKFMEYFTGCALSYPITQEMITSFRFKLASILLCWKTNTASRTTIVEESGDDTNGDPDDVQILESLDDIKKSKQKIPLSVENKYISLISILSNMSVHELTAGLCSFIKSINYTEILEKVWIQSSKPYPISLSLKKLQEMLKDDLPMDQDCFNLVVRKMMFDDIQTAQKTKQSIAKHYLDMKFWMTTDFGRHPDFRKKLDVEQLANSVRNWPGIKYNVSTCKTIHIPVQSNSDFILFTLDKDTRTVYILDPAPINPIYRRNPLAKYVCKIIWIAEHLPKAMSKACPGSIWNENILLWHQKILDDIPVYNRELSGYLVPLFMSTWENERPHLPILKDGYELKKIILGQLLTFKDNESEDNMPAGVLEFISCIRKIQCKTGRACYF